LSKLTSAKAQQLHTNALVREGVAYAASGDWNKSLELNDRVIDRYRQSSDADVLESVAWAMVNKGYDLSQLNRRDDAIAVYRDLAESIPIEEPFVDALSQGLMNWASDLSSMNRHAEEIGVYDRIEALIAKTSNLKLQSRRAWSIVNKGITLLEEERYAEANEFFEVVIRRWWEGMSLETPMALHEALAASGRYRGRCMIMLGRFSDAVKAIEPIVNRYASAHDRGIDEEVAWAALTKAFAEEKLGHIADAQRTCRFVERRYHRSQPEQASIARRALERLSTRRAE
jgi:hypothetical protein